jgi:hypothetical protein
MKNCRYVSILLLLINQVDARSNFWSSSYSSSSSSEQEVVNGKVIKSKKKKASLADTKAGHDNKVTSETTDFRTDTNNADSLMGIEFSGENYFNFADPDMKIQNRESKNIIKLVTGTCSITALGNGLSDTQLAIVKKDAEKYQPGDFMFGIFNSSNKKITNNLAQNIIQEFYDYNNSSDVQIIADGLAAAKEYNDTYGYVGKLDAGVGILRNYNLRKELTVWCPFGCKAAVFNRGIVSECDDLSVFKNIVKGDILLFGTNTFWSAINSEQAIKYARKNISRKYMAQSAIDVARDLITLARKKGCNDAMNVLVIYIL